MSFRLRSLRQNIDWLLLADFAALAIAVPMVLAPRVEWTPLLLALPAVWLARWRRDGSPVPLTSLNVPLLAMGLMLLVSLWATFSIEFSLAKISGLLFSMALFFVVVRLALSRMDLALAGFLAAGIGVSLLGLVGTDWHAKVPGLAGVVDRLPRWITGLPAAETGIHPNELGGVLILFVPFVVVLAFKGRLTWRVPGWVSRTLVGSVAGLLLAVTLLTQSRSALMGLAAAIALLLGASGRWGRITLGVLTVLAALVVWQIGPATLLGLETATEASPVGEITFASRFEIWSRALYGLQDFIFTGMGMNTFRRVAPVLYPFFMIHPDRDVAHAHNLFLQTGLDLGVPGLIAYLSLWLGGAVMLIRVYNRQSRDPVALGLTPAALALGLGGGLLAHGIYGLTDAVALGAKPGFLWWYLLGVVVGLHQLEASGKRR